MSTLFGSSTPRVQQPQPTPASGLRIQTSAQGTGLALIGGKVRVSGNLIDYDDFTAIATSTGGGGGGGGGGKGGGSSSGCFAPEVVISGPTGGISIGEIKIGDPVWCIDPATGARVAGKVQAVLVHDVAESGDKMIRIHHQGGILHVTTNHYLWDEAWPDFKREAASFAPGDALVHETRGASEIVRVQGAPDIEHTYNLVILPHHNFFADGILAHNGGGGGSGKGGSTSYTYTAALAFGLGEGPIQAVNMVWSSGTPSTLASANFTEFLGTQGQSAWGYLTTNHPNKSLSYSNIAYVAAGPYSLGTNTSLPSLTFEVVGNIANAVTETWTVASPYTYQATKWALADSVTEQATVPGTAPFVVAAVNPGATNAAPVMMSQITGTIPGSASCGVQYLGGAYLTPVSGTPSAGQYSVDTSGNYTFAAADAGAQIIIIDLALSPGVTYAGGSALTQVLSSPAQGQFSVSASGLYTFNAADAGQVLTIVDVADADPSAWVADVLTNPRYGAGFPAANLGTLSQLQSYAYSQGLFISPCLSASQALNTFLGDLCKGLNGEFVWSAGLLNWVPYGDTAVSGNGHSWSPPSAPIYSLDDDDFLPNAGTASVGVSSYTSQDPVIGAVKRQADCFNDIKIEYLDRGNNYNPAVAEAYDGAEITVFGRRSADTKSLHFFCSEQAAWVSCQLQLGRQGVRNQYTFTVPWYFIMFDPMDVIAITDSAMGLSAQWVRVLEITENQQDQSLTITAEEYLQGTGTAPLFGGRPKAAYAPNFDVSAGNALAPIIFEAPVQIATTGLEVWLATAGGPNWAGCQVWVSSDGATYKNVGSVTNPCRIGALSAAFPLGADPDTTDTLAVNLAESRGTMLSGSQADANLGNTSCWIVNPAGGGEAVSYETATLTSQYNYNLGTYLRRGMYGTTIAAHASGANFVCLDGAVFRLPYDKSQIGATVYVKLVSYNQWGGGMQELSEVTAYTHTIQGPPPPPAVTGFTVAQQGTVMGFAWDAITTDFALQGYDLGYAPPGTTNWAAYTPISDVTRGTEVATAGIPPGTWLFGIVGHDIAGQLSPTITTFGPVTVANAQSVIAAPEQDPAWTGTLTGFLRHYTGVLVPDSSVLASALTNAQLFTAFVPAPVAVSTYDTAAFGDGILDTVRIWANIAAGLGPAGQGNVNTSLAIDWSPDGVAWNGVWTNWAAIGTEKAAYIKMRLIQTNSAGACLITGFTPTIDVPLKSEVVVANVAAGGGAVTFANTYHAAPAVNAGASGAGLSSASVTSPSRTGCTGHAWTGASDVGGQITLTVGPSP